MRLHEQHTPPLHLPRAHIVRQILVIILLGLALITLPSGTPNLLPLVLLIGCGAPLLAEILRRPPLRPLAVLVTIFVILLVATSYLALLEATVGFLTGTQVIVLVLLPLIGVVVPYGTTARPTGLRLLLLGGALSAAGSTAPRWLILPALLALFAAALPLVLPPTHARITRLPWLRLAGLLVCATLLASVLPVPTLARPPLWPLLATLGASLAQPWLPLAAPPSAYPDTLSLQASLTLHTAYPVFAFTTTEQPAYLEHTAYADYHDATWWPDTTSVAVVDPGTRVADGAEQSAMVAATTTVRTLLGGSALIGPGRITSVSVPAQVTAFAPGDPQNWTATVPLAPNATYSVTSDLMSANAATLRAIPAPDANPAAYPSALMTRYTHLPSTLTGAGGEILRRTATQWASGATTMEDRLLALVTHFHQAPFVYSLTNPAPPAGTDAATWILTTRRGFCTWYATTFTLMARLLGYPARLMTGYVPGTYDALSNTWTISSVDAHAWSQVWFPQVGWVDFDATNGFDIDPNPIFTSPAAQATAAPVTPNKSTTPDVAGPLWPAIPWWVLWADLGGAVLSGGGWWLLGGRRPRRPLPLAEQQFTRMVGLASLWHGHRIEDGETASEYGARLARHFPQAADAITALTERYVTERWGTTKVSMREVRSLWQRIRQVLLTPRWLRRRRR